MQLSSKLTRQLSTLEKLPLEIRRRIYQFLLKADSVHQSFNNQMVREYHFQLAILRVSKQIYGEAYDMLYRDNAFVAIFFNGLSSHFWANLGNYGVAALGRTIPDIGAQFKEHDLRLDVTLPVIADEEWSSTGKTKEKDKALNCVVLMACELPRFVRMLRIFISRNPFAKFRLAFYAGSKESPSPASFIEGMRIWEPFRCLRMESQATRFMDSSDSEYVARLGVSMEPKVHWIRGRAWEAYDLALSSAHSGDEAFQLGKFYCAARNYGYSAYIDDTVDAQGRIFGERSHLTPLEDKGLTTSFLELKRVARIKQTLARLRDKDWKRVKLTAENYVAEYPASPESLIYHCLGVALAATHEDEYILLRCFYQALRLDPDNLMIKDHVAKACLGIDLSDSTVSAEPMYGDKSLELLNSPHEYSPPTFVPSDTIANERYLLRHFGYPGDLLEEIEETAQVDLERMDRVIQDITEHRMAQDSKGTVHSVWIGGDHWLSHVDGCVVKHMYDA